MIYESNNIVDKYSDIVKILILEIRIDIKDIKYSFIDILDFFHISEHLANYFILILKIYTYH